MRGIKFITGYMVHNPAYKLILQTKETFVFWITINCSQMKLLNFENWSNMASCQKLEMIFESKVILQLSYQKLSITKNVLLNSYHSMSKSPKGFG